MNTYGISVCANKIGNGVLTAENNGTKAFEIEYENQTVTAKVYFQNCEKPLILTAPAQKDDRLKLSFHRACIELYVNEKLMDEEWPIANNLLENVRYIGWAIYLTAISKPTEPQPIVLGEFNDAEGWKPDENVFVGDCMPYFCDGRYHIMYLKDRRHHKSKYGYGAHQWEHISTDDFGVWQIHPMAVEIDALWEGSICTGSHIQKDGTHYLWYTVRTCDGSPAPIRRSLSSDGYHFQKDRKFGFTLSEKYNQSCARDPKVFLGADGLYHMLLTTTLISENKGCLAHLVSEDMENFCELEPIYVSPTSDEPECADYFFFNNKYYLVYSLRGIGRYMYSDMPFSEWHIPENSDIPCKSVPKAAIFDNRIIFSGFDGNGEYAGTLTFTEAFAAEDGSLKFKKMFD